MESETIEVPAIHATGMFGQGSRTASADLYFLDNKNNP